MAWPFLTHRPRCLAPVTLNAASFPLTIVPGSSPMKKLAGQLPNPADPNHRILEENRERLEGARLEDGSRPEVVRLPMPASLHFARMRLPASYANFYIANCATLVPTFNDPRDREALGIIAGLIPDRPAIGIHAVDLVWGLGTLHCLTQQEPGEGQTTTGSLF